MICSKCGGTGPFPAKRRGNRCNACIAERQRNYHQKRRPISPEKNAAKQRKWRKNNPDAAAEIASRNYRKRKASGKVNDWKHANREKINRQARERKGNIYDRNTRTLRKVHQ